MLNLEAIKQYPSPNFRPRYTGEVRNIVIHAACGTLAGTTARFLDPRSQVSAHYMVDRDGTIVQFVKETDEAWHVCRANPFTIGIEHTDMWPISGQRALQGGCMVKGVWTTPQQLDASASLVAYLLNKYKLKPEAVIGHNDPYLKGYGNNHQDPGPYFPWPGYRQKIAEILREYGGGAPQLPPPHGAYFSGYRPPKSASTAPPKAAALQNPPTKSLPPEVTLSLATAELTDNSASSEIQFPKPRKARR